MLYLALPRVPFPRRTTYTLLLHLPSIMGAKRRQRGSAAGARQGIAERIADLLGDPEARQPDGCPRLAARTLLTRHAL